MDTLDYTINILDKKFPFFESAMDILSEQGIKDALEFIEGKSTNDRIKKKVLILKGRLHNLKDEEFKGTLSSDHIIREKNKIRSQIIELFN